MATDNLTYLPTGTESGLPANDVKPAVGVPATYQSGPNSYAGEIIEVHANGRTLVWQGGRSKSLKETFTLRSDGQYRLRSNLRPALRGRHLPHGTLPRVLTMERYSTYTEQCKVSGGEPAPAHARMPHQH